MKKDTALAALNFNYSHWAQARESQPFMSLELLSLSDKGQSGGRLAGHTKWRLVYYIRMRSWTWPCWDPVDECTLASQISLCRCPYCLQGCVVDVFSSKKKNVARTTIVESGLSHEGKSIRMLQSAVNIYPFSLTAIEFPWWALTIQRERDQC